MTWGICAFYLLYQTNSEVMSDEMDCLRIGCFERTGCLITRDIDVELDKNITNDLLVLYYCE